MTLAVKVALNPNTTNQPTVTGLVENVGEGENAALSSLRAILFPQCFQKTCILLQRRKN